MVDVPPFKESFLARIVNVNWGLGPILVLDLVTGVGAPQSGVPPMLLTGVSGQPVNVFSIPYILKPKGKPTAIVDPISSAMLANFLVWSKNLKVTANTGSVFLFCNVTGMRAGFKNPLQPLTFELVTPAAQNLPPGRATYYWELDARTFNIITQFSGNPVSPLPVLFGKNGVVSVWTDSSFGGTGNFLIAGFTGDIQGPVDFGDPANRFHGQIDVFTTTANDNFFAEIAGSGSPFSIHTETFDISKIDTTSWGIRAGLWKKQKAFAELLPVPPSDVWPIPPPSIQPDSNAFTGGFSVPSKIVTVTVSAPPDSTVTLRG